MMRAVGIAPATKQDILLLQHEIALLRQELLGIRIQLGRETAGGFTPLFRSIDTFRDDMERKFAAFERRLTIRFGVMFFTGCGLTIAAGRLWA